MTGPIELLGANRRAVVAAAADVGAKRLKILLARAQDDLNRRLRKAEGLFGPGNDSFTANQLRVSLVQVQHVLLSLKKGIKALAVAQAKGVADPAVEGVIRYLHAAEKRYAGITERLPLKDAILFDRARSGAESSVLHRLEGDPQKGPGILQRYGDGVVEKFEGHLQQRLLARAPWEDVRNQLIADSPFLQQAPAHWAERIVRNECLVGSTRVTAAVVRAVFRRPYQGDVVIIVTERGRELTTTPNHPMLTRRGWVSARALNGDDHLVGYNRKEHHRTASDHDVDHRQIALDELFVTAANVGVVERVRCARDDFHGDGFDGEVEAARPFRTLNVGSFAPIYEPLSKHVFSPSHLSVARYCSACRRLLSIDEQPCLCWASNGNASAFEPGLHSTTRNAERRRDDVHGGSGDVTSDDRIVVERELVRTRTAVLEEQDSRIGERASSNASSFKQASNRRAPNAEADAELLAAHPRNIEFDRVRSVRRVHFSGHVYGLETPYGYYAANGVITGNSMNGSNRAIWEANKAADEQLGDVVKILSATFDNRTGADSVAVHGQIRRPNEAFEWWDGLYQHPPNRPNDREVVVTHRISWPIPAELAFRSDAEVAARWVENGRKGAPPARPKMTTVDLEKFGNTPPPAIEEEAPAPFALARKRPIMEPPAIPEKPTRGAVASPFFDENVAPWKTPDDVVPEVQAPVPIDAPLPDLGPTDYFAKPEGGAKGSNEGGFFRGSDGVLRYAKFYKDPVQGQLEHLANNIYKDLGLPAVKSNVVTAPDGRQAYVSDVVEGETLAKKGLDKKAAKQVLKGFAADVLVKNWDAVGLDHDNVVIGKGGAAVRIDNGGALLHRAKAGLKPEASLHALDEWTKFFEPGTNPAYAKVAAKAGVYKAEDVVGLKAQLQAIQKLRVAHGGWGNYVDSVTPNMPKETRDKVVLMLAERSSQLVAKLKGLKAAAKLPKDQKPARAFDKLPVGNIPEMKHVPAGWESRAPYQGLVRPKIEALQQKIAGFNEALATYTSGGYGPIRDAGVMSYEQYQQKHSSTSRASYDRNLAQYHAIDKAFEEHSKAESGPIANAPEAKVKDMFRGLRGLDKATFDQFVGAHTWETESITSTAWDPQVAKGFAGSQPTSDRYRIVLHFRMKPTSRNKLAVETHSSTGAHETEILLRKGTRFSVADVKRWGFNGALIELEEQD